MRHQTRMTRYCQMLASPAVTFMLSRTTLRRLGRLLMKRQIGASTFQGASAVTDNGTRAPNTSYFARRYTSKRQQHPQKRVLTKQHRQERTCSLNQCSRAVDLKPHHIIISENYIHE